MRATCYRSSFMGQRFASRSRLSWGASVATTPVSTISLLPQFAVCNADPRNQIDQSDATARKSAHCETAFFAPIVFGLLNRRYYCLMSREGLWKLAVTRSMSGVPAAPNIPPDALARMPPDERARVEAMVKGPASIDVRKECVTKEKLANHSAFGTSRGDCTRTVVSSTGRKREMKVHGEEKQPTTDGSYGSKSQMPPGNLCKSRKPRPAFGAVAFGCSRGCAAGPDGARKTRTA
jgi:hypothetical protein